MPNLQGDDLVWLVDYLDEVRRCVALPLSPFKSAQALGDLDPSSSTSRTCLRELRNICGTRAILPTSYTLSPDLLTIGPNPFASGSYGDVYEGTLDGSRVCTKRARVYAQDGPRKTTKVRLRCRPLLCPPLLTKLADVPPRGHCVETLGTPKRTTPAGDYYHSFPVRFELDVWRGPARIHQGDPNADRLRLVGIPPVTFVPRLPPFPVI